MHPRYSPNEEAASAADVTELNMSFAREWLQAHEIPDGVDDLRLLTLAGRADYEFYSIVWRTFLSVLNKRKLIPYFVSSAEEPQSFEPADLKDRDIEDILKSFIKHFYHLSSEKTKMFVEVVNERLKKTQDPSTENKTVYQLALLLAPLMVLSKLVDAIHAEHLPHSPEQLTTILQRCSIVANTISFECFANTNISKEVIPIKQLLDERIQFVKTLLSLLEIETLLQAKTANTNSARFEVLRGNFYSYSQGMLDFYKNRITLPLNDTRKRNSDDVIAALDRKIKEIRETLDSKLEQLKKQEAKQADEISAAAKLAPEMVKGDGRFIKANCVNPSYPANCWYDLHRGTVVPEPPQNEEGIQAIEGSFQSNLMQQLQAPPIGFYPVIPIILIPVFQPSVAYFYNANMYYQRLLFQQAQQEMAVQRETDDAPRQIADEQEREVAQLAYSHEQQNETLPELVRRFILDLQPSVNIHALMRAWDSETSQPAVVLALETLLSSLVQRVEQLFLNLDQLKTAPKESINEEIDAQLKILATLERSNSQLFEFFSERCLVERDQQKLFQKRHKANCSNLSLLQAKLYFSKVMHLNPRDEAGDLTINMERTFSGLADAIHKCPSLVTRCELYDQQLIMAKEFMLVFSADDKTAHGLIDRALDACKLKIKVLNMRMNAAQQDEEAYELENTIAESYHQQLVLHRLRVLRFSQQRVGFSSQKNREFIKRENMARQAAAKPAVIAFSLFNKNRYERINMDVVADNATFLTSLLTDDLDNTVSTVCDHLAENNLTKEAVFTRVNSLLLEAIQALLPDMTSDPTQVLYDLLEDDEAHGTARLKEAMNKLDLSSDKLNRLLVLLNYYGIFLRETQPNSDFAKHKKFEISKLWLELYELLPQKSSLVEENYLYHIQSLANGYLHLSQKSGHFTEKAIRYYQLFFNDRVPKRISASVSGYLQSLYQQNEYMQMLGFYGKLKEAGLFNIQKLSSKQICYAYLIFNYLTKAHENLAEDARRKEARNIEPVAQKPLASLKHGQLSYRLANRMYEMAEKLVDEKKLMEAQTELARALSKLIFP